LKIVKVETRKDLLRFINLPFALYRDNEFWVPPLVSEQVKFFDAKKNPYYEHSEVQLFMVCDDTQVLGRISAHTNVNHNKFHDDKKGFFGFFECVNDQKVADMLFCEAVKWLQEKGCDVISGPFNLSTNDECGLLIEGFEVEPYIMMPYNHSYYTDLIEGSGLVKAMDMYAWKLPTTNTPLFLEKLAHKIESRGNFTVRSLDKKNLKRDIEEVFTIYQKAWERNWGFVPMTRREFDHMVKTLLMYVDPEMVFIAKYNDEPAGFSVSLPNYNVVLKEMKGKLNILSLMKFFYYKSKIKSSRCITMGVVHEYQGKGIDTLFYYYSLKNGLKNGITEGELSWVLETNTMMNKIVSRLGAYVNKKYRIYEKVI
jgi:hypothetical protein